MDLWLERVPTRQEDMKDWEILLSESQERMLVVVEKGKEDIVNTIFDKWDLSCEEIGIVTKGERVRYFMHGELVGDVPCDDLVLGGGAPVYNREWSEPAYYQDWKKFQTDDIEQPEDLVEVAKFLTGHENIASKRWVYFEIDTSPEKYGQLTGQSLDMVRAGAGGRVADTGSGKRDHRDFALWKSAKPNEPSWPSPWGEGRPGWHIECSAMSLKLLGERFDIHGGGTDLLFPHHEAEIFQSECCLGHDPVVQYWIHNGMINVDGEKMSKSLGNFWTIKDALEQVNPLVLRYTMINAPYRQPIDFNQKMLDESSVHHKRMVSVYGESLSSFGTTDWGDVEILESASKRFATAMNDDFNTRNAVVEVQSVVNSLRSLLDNGADADILAAGAGWLSEFAGEILGLLPTDESIQKMMAEEESARSELESIVEPLLKERAEARASKDWPRADEIRDKLNELGVVVEDSPDGPVWRLQ